MEHVGGPYAITVKSRSHRLAQSEASAEASSQQWERIRNAQAKRQRAVPPLAGLSQDWSSLKGRPCRAVRRGHYPSHSERATALSGVANDRSGARVAEECIS